MHDSALYAVSNHRESGDVLAVPGREHDVEVAAAQRRDLAGDVRGERDLGDEAVDPAG